MSEESRTETGDKILGFIPADWRLNLTALPGVRWLFKQRWFPAVPILINMFVFVVILTAGVMGGFSPGNYNFGIMIVWILWWVLLMMLLVPVFSRGWCMVCPLPSLGEWLQRLRIFGVAGDRRGLNLKWPKSLNNMWLMNILFVATTFFSGFFTVRPYATFVLLGGIIVLGIVLSLVFEKRTFCLYVCPVSGFQGLYSNMGMTEIRANDMDVCAKHKKKTCVTGTKKGFGCPWLLKPYEFERNTYCGMCLECFKTCPFDNINFNLRPPGVDILKQRKRGLDEAWKAFIMLGIAVMFYSAMMGPWGFLKDWVRGASVSGWTTFAALHTVFNFAVIPGIFFFFAWLSKVLSREKEVSLKAAFVNFSYSLVPMGLAAWIAFSFGFLLPNGSYIIHVLSDPLALGWNLFGTAGFPWTPVLTRWLVVIQYVVLFGGYVFSADIAYKLSCQTYTDETAARRGVVPILAVLAGIAMFFGWLFGG